MRFLSILLWLHFVTVTVFIKFLFAVRGIWSTNFVVSTYTLHVLTYFCVNYSNSMLYTNG